MSDGTFCGHQLHAINFQIPGNNLLNLTQQIYLAF